MQSQRGNSSTSMILHSTLGPHRRSVMFGMTLSGCAEAVSSPAASRESPCNQACTVCQGYDNCWIYDHDESIKPGVTLWSDVSGIKCVSSPLCLKNKLTHPGTRLDITTNQPAVQVYTAYWLDTPRKLVHGGPSLNYTSWTAVAIEQEGYIDAINTPEWAVDQICESSPIQ